MKIFELRNKYPGKPDGVQEIVSSNGHVWATITPTFNTKGRRRYAVRLTDIQWVGEYRDFDDALAQVSKLLDSVPESEGQSHTIWIVSINGYLWEQGKPCELDIQFDHQPTEDEVAAKAGDFQEFLVRKVVRRDVVFTDSELAA